MQLDQRGVGMGERVGPVSDGVHDGPRLEPGGHDRPLHLANGLEQLDVHPEVVLAALALGDVELGAQVAKRASPLVEQRPPRTGAPADLPLGRDHPVFLAVDGLTAVEPLPLLEEEPAVFGMNVFEEVAILEIGEPIAGQPLEGGVHEPHVPLGTAGHHGLVEVGGQGVQAGAQLGPLQLSGAAAAAVRPEAQSHAACAQRDAGGAGTKDRQKSGVYHVRFYRSRAP